MPVLPTPVIDQPGPGDAEQPGAEGQPPFLVSRQIFDHLQEHIGREIFRHLRIAQAVEEIAVDPIGVMPIQGRDGLGVPLAGPGDPALLVRMRGEQAHPSSSYETARDGRNVTRILSGQPNGFVSRPADVRDS